ILLRHRRVEDVYLASLYSTRLGVLVVMALAVVWAHIEAGQLLLVEMGLLSFVAVTQCAPAVFLGLYWRRGSRVGAFAGISAGFAMWLYTLILPTLVREGVVPASIVETGPLGLTALRPTALLGIEGLDQLTHGVFWSLLVNVGAYVLASIWSRQDAEERSQSAAFVGVKDSAPAPIPAILSLPEIERLIHLYVPPEEADRIRAHLLGGNHSG